MSTTKSKKGQFKTKNKFIELIGGKGYINFLSNEAIIDGNQLSGLDMDGIKFKLTICDEGVDFEELDTNQTTKEQRGRLLDIIEEKTVSRYKDRNVIRELTFDSVTKVKDKTVPLYLAIKVEKPISILADIISETTTATKTALSNLDSLLDELDDDNDDDFDIEGFSKKFDEIANNMFESKVNVNSEIEKSFNQMKESKLKELIETKSKNSKELSKLQTQLETIKSTIDKLNDENNLLEDRINDLKPIPTPLGYFFNVSERKNEKVTLEPNIEQTIREKVSKVKSINVDNFMKLFTDGEFHIKLSDKNDDANFDYETLSEEAKSALSELNLLFYDDKFIYTGDLIWSQIVNKLIKLGFTQDSTFDELCGSNSYISNDIQKEDLKTIKNTF